ncbi:hypothetical protein AKO1_007906 [Acrasis kona]|uniref:Uncharacterized protein n=1 Tax=Acrasis kona TaxID=1008807 RepID=A0AAW2YPG1_9EUKA
MELSKANETIQRLSDDLFKLESSFNEYKSAHEQIYKEEQSSTAQLRNKMFTSKEKVSTLTKEKESLVAHAEQVQVKLAEANEKLSTLQKNHSELVKHRDRLKAQLLDSTNKSQQSNEEWNKLVNTATTLKESLRIAQEEASRKNKLASQYKSEKEQDAEKIKTLENDLSKCRDSDDKTKKLKSELQRKDQLVQDLKTRIASMEAEISQIKDNHNAASNQYKNKIVAMRSELSARLTAQFSAQTKIVEDSNQKLTKEVKDLEIKLESKDTQIKKQKIIINEMEMELEKAKSDMTSLQNTMRDSYRRTTTSSTVNTESTKCSVERMDSDLIIESEPGVSMTILTHLTQSEYDDIMKTLPK